MVRQQEKQYNQDAAIHAMMSEIKRLSGTRSNVVGMLLFGDQGYTRGQVPKHITAIGAGYVIAPAPTPARICMPLKQHYHDAHAPPPTPLLLPFRSRSRSCSSCCSPPPPHHQHHPHRHHPTHRTDMLCRYAGIVQANRLFDHPIMGSGQPEATKLPEANRVPESELLGDGIWTAKHKSTRDLAIAVRQHKRSTTRKSKEEHVQTLRVSLTGIAVTEGMRVGVADTYAMCRAMVANRKHTMEHTICYPRAASCRPWPLRDAVERYVNLVCRTQYYRSILSQH